MQLKAITAADVGSSSTTGIGGQTIVTGTPTAGSVVQASSPGAAAAVIRVAGTWSGTLLIEKAFDGSNLTWHGDSATPFGEAGTPVTSITANGAVHLSAGLCTGVRVRCTVLGSGSPSVAIDFGPTITDLVTSGSGGGGAGLLSANVVYASKHGIVGDASATIGVSSSGWTDNTAAIQTIFDLSKTAPTWVVFDNGICATKGNTVDLSSHGLQITFMPGCGLNGLPGGSSYTAGALKLGHGLIANANPVAGTGTILDVKKLIIEGGIFVGGRTRPTGNGWSGGTNASAPIGRSFTGDGNKTDAGTQFAMGAFSLYGVADVTIRNCIIYDSAAFSMHLANVTHARISNCNVKAIDTGVDGLDAIHVNGPARDVEVNGCILSVPNDNIAFNADDGNNGPYVNLISPFVTGGNITDSSANHCFIDGGSGAFRVLSGTSLIDQVWFNDCYGTVTDDVVIGTLDAADPGAPPGNGNWGTWGITNCSITGGGNNYGTAYWLGGTHKHVVLKNCKWSPTSLMTTGAVIDIGADFAATAFPTNIGLLEVDGMYGIDTVGISPCPLVRLSGNSGGNVIGTLNVTNPNLLQTSGPTADQPVFRLTSGTITNVVVEGGIVGKTSYVVDLIAGSGPNGTNPKVSINTNHIGDNITPYSSFNSAIAVTDLYIGKPGPKDIGGAGSIFTKTGAGIGALGRSGNIAERFNAQALWPLNGLLDCYGTNNLTNNNGVTFTAGKIGNAATLVAASSQYLSIADNSVVRQPNGDYMRTVIVKLASKPSNGMIIFSKGDQGTSTALEEECYWDNVADRFGFFAGNGAASVSNVVANSFGPPTIGTAYVVNCWVDKVNNIVGIRVNNLQDVTPLNNSLGTTSDPFLIGAVMINGSPSLFFDGQIESLGLFGAPFGGLAGQLNEQNATFYGGGNGVNFASLTGGGGGAGTVTSVASGTGLTGGPITTTGTLSLDNTAVTPASYTLASITVDQQGRITDASNGAVTNITGNAATATLAANVTTNANLTGDVTSVGNATTVSASIVKVAAKGRSAAQIAAVPSVVALTVGGADASYLVSANVLVNSATVTSFTVTVAYTDDGNNARTLVLTFSQITGTLVQTITNVTGAGAYEGVPLHIRAKAGTTITFSTTGTFTTVNYNVEGYITQIG